MKKKKIPVTVSVKPTYVPEQSDVAHQKFVWSYEVTITNESDQILQLLHRFWRIIDMTGRIEEIHGAGVVGLQPLLKPGKQFVYISFCQLTTPQGTMEGHYDVQNLEEEHFDVQIPKFILSAPTTITSLYKSKLH